MHTFTPEQFREFQADIDGDFIAKTKKTLVLVGLMGSGKTALGKRLAVALNRAFVDSDHLVEQEAGLSVRDIFDIGGEAKFRELERRMIAKNLTGNPVILSTGGGAFCDPQTRAAITKQAISLWLDSAPEDLLERIGNVASRPLLADGDPLTILSELRTQRLPAYSQADLHVVTGPDSRRVSMKKVLCALEESGYIAPLPDPKPDTESSHKA